MSYCARMGSKQTEQNGDLVQRIERVTEVPMLILAFCFLVGYVLELFPDFSDSIQWEVYTVDNVIIAIFAAQLVVKLAVAKDRITFLRTHWIDVLIVVVRFLRPLRFLRLLRLAPFLLRFLDKNRRNRKYKQSRFHH